MPEMLGSIGTFFGGSSGKGLLDVLGLGSAGLGLFGNIETERARSQQLDMIKNAEKTLGDPNKLAREVAAATQPLNSGLVQSVGNVVSGSEAERGLSQAPGIQATELAQALAPFEQQNQNTALQLVMERLGLPIQYANAYLQGLPKGSNISPLLALLMRQNNPSGSSFSGFPDTSSIPSDTGSLLSSFGSFAPPSSGTFTDSPIDLSGFFGGGEAVAA